MGTCKLKIHISYLVIQLYSKLISIENRMLPMLHTHTHKIFQMYEKSMNSNCCPISYDWCRLLPITINLFHTDSSWMSTIISIDIYIEQLNNLEMTP